MRRVDLGFIDNDFNLDIQEVGSLVKLVGKLLGGMGLGHMALGLIGYVPAYNPWNPDADYDECIRRAQLHQGETYKSCDRFISRVDLGMGVNESLNGSVNESFNGSLTVSDVYDGSRVYV